VPAVVLIDARAPDARMESDKHDTPYLKLNASGGPQVLEARDRLSDAELRYAKAMDAYAGRTYGGHVIVVKARQRNVASAVDLGWSHFASSIEVHELPGTHGTMLTRHLGELVTTIRGALARAANVTA
jgi:thioesterase domain-containing protein